MSFSFDSLSNSNSVNGTSTSETSSSFSQPFQWLGRNVVWLANKIRSGFYSSVQPNEKQAGNSTP
jgi:hypothetical protein